MKDIFKITKHINEWKDRQNIDNRLYGALTSEAIVWYKNRALVEICSSCILAWNKNRLKSCKSATVLQACFYERGINDLKRELFGCLYITMPNLKYMVQVFSDTKTTCQICGCSIEERCFMKMSAKEIVDFIIDFDSYVPKIIEMVDQTILNAQQERYIDQIAEASLPAIMDSFTANTILKYEIVEIMRGKVKLVLSPVGKQRLHIKISMPFEQVSEKMAKIIPAFETIVTQAADSHTQLEMFSYSYR